MNVCLLDHPESLPLRTKTSIQADKMLDAAAQLFATHRFHEVRMEDIAAEATVGKGTLYRYFSDKDELYLALLERASRHFIARLEEAVGPIAGARDRLVALVDAIIANFDEQPHLLDLIQRAEIVRGTGEGFPWKQARDESLRIVSSIFKEGKDRGEFQVRDPDLRALMLLGGLRAVLRFGKRPRARDLGARIVEGFLHGADAGAAIAADPQRN
jgi:AcrR family transcriptional regulator